MLGLNLDSIYNFASFAEQPKRSNIPLSLDLPLRAFLKRDLMLWINLNSGFLRFVL